MKLPLATLLLNAAAELPPQRPSKSPYAPYLPVMVMLHTTGHEPGAIADFLIAQKEIKPTERKSAQSAISNLLARHSPLA